MFIVWLILETTRLFILGKAKGNRIFAHRQAALSMLSQSDYFEEDESARTLKNKNYPRNKRNESATIELYT